MNQKRKTYFLCSTCFLLAFAVWTVLVSTVDVRPIGPRGSCVGFSAFNGAFHGLTGVSRWLYNLTDWLGLLPIATALGFAVWGCVQWIRRKSILRVDRSLLALGAFYVAVLLVYLLFEQIPVNYRPVLIGGALEVSYPSSTTVLVVSVILGSYLQCAPYLKGRAVRIGTKLFVAAFVGFMVVGRALSGVHWISDIIGGLLISLALVAAYAGAIEKNERQCGCAE